MNYLQQSFTVKFEYKVFFTSGLFSQANPLLNDFLKDIAVGNTPRKILFVIDQGFMDAGNDVLAEIRAYFELYHAVQLVSEIIVVPGGEIVKNDIAYFDRILEAVNTCKIDRHSYIAAIGGGSVLDMVGYAAAVSHRGIRHIRIPTTVLSQNDSGIGVKNGINYFAKKNFLGTFAPPVAVFNDEQYLKTLNERHWRSGISEAVKVALIKDPEFFHWLENNAGALVDRDLETMNYLIKRCAELHMQHIAGKDPFESGSSRPLDFGHWSAHKLEQLSNFEVLHGEAVAMGMALDTVYSNLSGHLSDSESHRILDLLLKLGFALSHPVMQISEGNSAILSGLEEFREHLGGELTIMLLDGIGKGFEVHCIDNEILKRSSEYLIGLSHTSSKA
ncbi:MAG: 3-dehydroquinate synthase [Daejeonella sp.]|uniref:3-dehydroquinate synthase n=1 Tax=Daejeonella sp. TaxID=2805397 RepID=UPI0027354EFB|nr:3-dehydroquinate synthase [Daejeonella sp.]MDP3469704.1 3-dehydroquinate synthase [Daejeonella sp.]